MALISPYDRGVWGLRLKRDRPRKPIGSYRQLVQHMERTRAPLVKTLTPTGPAFEVAGWPVLRAVAESTLNEGWMRPLDDGLFGDSPQSWQLEVRHGEY